MIRSLKIAGCALALSLAPAGCDGGATVKTDAGFEAEIAGGMQSSIVLYHHGVVRIMTPVCCWSDLTS